MEYQNPSLSVSLFPRHHDESIYFPNARLQRRNHEPCLHKPQCEKNNQFCIETFEPSS